MKISKRVFVSFDEYCANQCKFCYTYAIDRKSIRSVPEIVDSISQEDFDVIYVSQKNDNFSDPYKGLELCNQLADRYSSSLFVITRTVFNDDQIKGLVNLRNKLEHKGQSLFIAISMSATRSTAVCEDITKVCSTTGRIDFLSRLSKKGLSPILMLRPVFPDSIVPVSECIEIIESTHEYISCVVSSGLGVNDDILHRLNMKPTDFSYYENQEYLQGAIECKIRFVNVDNELNQIKKECQHRGVQMFEHSMPALNYVLEKYK